MEIQKQYNQYAFQARPGKRLTKLVRKEYCGDETKVSKFKNVFNKAHNNLDTNTIINIDEKERYVFSNAVFPNIAYCYERKLVEGPLAEVVVTECPKIFAYGQLLLFRNIVRVLSEKNIPLEEIEKMGSTRIKQPSAIKTFGEVIETAKWIRENMPGKKMNQISFEVADNIIASEKLTKNREVLASYEHDMPSYIAKVREILG